MRKVLITGATSGFGKLIVKEFLNNGDFVIATGRNLVNRKDLFETERTLYEKKILELSLDVTDKSEIERVREYLESHNHGVDILINNAGYGLFGALEDLGEDEIRHQMEVNFFGTVNVTKSFLPLLRTSKGKIFNFSSVFGFMGFPLTSLYCASKFAVEGLTESLRGELAPHGVQLCLIEPGGYRTNFGSNLTWSLKASDSVFKTQFKNYQELHSKISQGKPQNPEDVSKGVLALSKRKKLPMRKVFGKDGKMSFILRRFLPTKFYFGIMDLFYKTVFSKGLV